VENKEIELKNFEDEYMIKVKGGKYKPSFANELKEVFDVEVCKYPTTQKMWLEVMENNPSGFKGDNRPVETVSWWEVLEYCNRLSEKYGLEPVYELSKSLEGILMIKELEGKIVSPDKVNFKNTEGFRLPTEVEWEWFASGGQKAEWCYDTIEFDENGDYKNIKNGNFYMYEAFDLSNTYRRVKGGSWGNGNKDCAIFHRGCNQAINVKEYFRYFGFRIVRTI